MSQISFKIILVIPIFILLCLSLFVIFAYDIEMANGKLSIKSNISKQIKSNLIGQKKPNFYLTPLNQQTKQKQYRRFHRVPANHPKYAGKPCCNACYILCKSQTEKCAFMDEGKCTYANKLFKKGERNIVYKNLTYRVPKNIFMAYY